MKLLGALAASAAIVTAFAPTAARSAVGRTTGQASVALSMKTYPINDEAGHPFAVEVDVVYCSVRDLARTIATVEGVTEVRVCKPFSGNGDIRAKFQYRGDEFAVIEPFGDNSRYWIGPVAENPKRDISPIERQLESYVPSFFRRVIGPLITLNLRASAGG